MNHPRGKDGTLRRDVAGKRGLVVNGTHKLEARNPKHETISNDKNPNDQNSAAG
jgi:hypothetical protein